MLSEAYLSTTDRGYASGDVYSTIQRLEDGIRAYVTAHGSQEEVEKLDYALEDIAKFHADQKRKSGQPVIIHPLRVALSICEAGLDGPTIIGALLHDLIEDTVMTKSDIRERYGDWYAEIVDSLTKIGHPKDSREKKQANLEATYQKMLTAMIKDVRSLFIKLFDRLDNMRDLSHLSRTKQRKISRETLAIYVPIARRLGLEKLSREHTELCFRYLYPIRYEACVQRIALLKEERKLSIESMLKHVESLLIRNNLSHVIVTPKYVDPSYFIHKVEVDRVLIGYQLQTKEALENYIVLGTLHTGYRAMPLKIRDFISNPRWDGYQALLTEIILDGETVPIEIVTQHMNSLNQHGIMAHWKGTATELAEYYQRYLEQLDEIAGEKDIRMNDILQYVQADEIQIYTPKGEVCLFPKGAKVLDFAYHIHSDLGNNCVGALVNPPGALRDDSQWEKRVSRERRLNNGEIVRIMRDPNVKPSRGWLDHVVTPKAKQHILKSLKLQNNFRALKVGKELMFRELAFLGKNPDEFVESTELKAALEQEKLTLDDFFIKIGLRKDHLENFLKEYQLVDLAKLERRNLRKNIFMFKQWNSIFNSETPDMVIEDVNDTFLRFADCCSPVPGDKIVGFATEENDLEIHRSSCIKAKSLSNQFPITIGWKLSNEELHSYNVNLITHDEAGVLFKITKIIKSVGVGIEDSKSSRLDDGDAYIHLTLEPITYKVYHKIMERLRLLKIVKKIW